ncbi:hypothetical protein AMIS_20280 [Actinoplanes missouriensis 431]|uniref:Uncharacterized protein n=1 Tax=Actinoplanes missouriensis (strain ATCC 14538 / DSM 43046 / CBS 188.64 / JCM 3121 / NBRC 102363 / NCIMB 12654 / NRRL B-3342 / UNCC 431) TaxID=512565 RepID=I0H2L1_ACTM4|nr:hypothetical protein [Actinoplanes missouriensis]BAL87248.1 hypothetical protein AMIS_20280 [Actinoplanes missouriensis 431]
MTSPAVATDDVLLDLWLDVHDDDTPDDLTAVLTVDTRIAVGVATYEPRNDLDEECL